MQFSCLTIIGVLFLVYLGEALECQVGYNIRPIRKGSSDRCGPSVGPSPTCFRVEVPAPNSGIAAYYGCTNGEKCSSLTCETSKDTIKAAIEPKVDQFILMSMMNCKIGCCVTRNCNLESIDSMRKKTTTSTNASTTSAETTMHTTLQQTVRSTALAATTANETIGELSSPTVKPSQPPVTTRPIVPFGTSSFNGIIHGGRKQYVDEAEKTTISVVEISTTSAGGSMYSFSLMLWITVSLIETVYVMS